MTLKTKRILLITIPAAVLIAAALLLWLWLGRGTQAEQPFEIWRDQNTGEINRCFLREGAERDAADEELPLPLYGLALESQWEQTENAAEQANRLSDFYLDRYTKETGEVLEFTQEPAVQGAEVTADQEVMFGQTQVIYYQQDWSGEDGSYSRYETGAAWVYGGSLLKLTHVGSAPLELNQMLELVGRADYQTYREPVYSPLGLQRGYSREVWLSETALSIESEPACSIGNPQIPEDPSFPQLNQLPEGFVEMPSYSSSGSRTFAQGYYHPDNNRRQILFHGWLGSNRYRSDGTPGGFYLLSNYEDSLQETTVNGNPAFFYIDEEESCIGWVDGYCTLELDLNFPVTQEELIALAESVE